MSPSVEMRDATVRAIKPDPNKQVEYLDTKEAGLALFVSPKGTKAWTMRYRNTSGKQRRISLGRYPTIGVAAARKRAKEIAVDVANGNDPALEKRKAKAESKAEKVSTVGDLIDSYFDAASKGRQRPGDKVQPKRASTMKNEREYFERLIRPKFGKLPISELDRPTLQKFLNLVGDNSPSAARQCRNVVRQAYNFAIWQEYTIKANPAVLVSVTSPEPRKRVLKDFELAAIWNACKTPHNVEGLSMSPTMGLSLMFAIVTLQRGGEVISLHTDELIISERSWLLPSMRSKNHREHLIPLSDLALSLIDKSLAHNNVVQGFVFPSPRGDGPITRHAFTRACKRLTSALGIDNATPHDFRRTGATNLTSERIGIRRFHVSQVLNHSSERDGAAVTGDVYDQNEYVKEKRDALDAWSVLLQEIVSGNKRAGNVVGINLVRK